MACVALEDFVGEVSLPSNTSSTEEKSFETKTHVKTVKLSNGQMKMLLKLGSYEACQIEDCGCNGWKSDESLSSLLKIKADHIAAFDKTCKDCLHDVRSHISSALSMHKNEMQLNVTGNDVFLEMQAGHAAGIKKINYMLFKLLRDSVLSKSDIADRNEFLGQPPFEEPTISAAINNFVSSRYEHSTENNQQLMKDSAKIFLQLLNKFRFKPTDNDWTVYGDEAACKLNYCRWLMFSYPALSGSPAYCDTGNAFGRAWLRMIFPSLKKQLGKKKDINHNLPSEKKVLFLNCFFTFLSALETDVYSEKSPIWNTSPGQDLEMQVQKDSKLSENNICRIDGLPEKMGTFQDDNDFTDDTRLLFDLFSLLIFCVCFLLYFAYFIISYNFASE